MKKDKAWIKDVINDEGIVMNRNSLGRHDEQYWKNENIKINKGRLFYLIDQLDEPEQTDTNVGLSKPVIPQFVADWYEENLSGGYTNNRNKFSGNDVFRVIQDVLNIGEGFNTWEDYNLDEKIVAWVEENEEDFIHLIANCSYKNGYDVEKEPDYFAKIKGHEFIQRIPTFDEDTGENTSNYHRRVYFVLQSNGDLIVDMKDNGLSGAKNIMTLSQWNSLGINEANADFEVANE